MSLRFGAYEKQKSSFCLFLIIITTYVHFLYQSKYVGSFQSSISNFFFTTNIVFFFIYSSWHKPRTRPTAAWILDLALPWVWTVWWPPEPRWCDSPSWRLDRPSPRWPTETSPSRSSPRSRRQTSKYRLRAVHQKFTHLNFKLHLEFMSKGLMIKLKI